MPDPFAKVDAGSDVTFSATAWNAMLGAGQEFSDGRLSRTSGELTTGRSSTLVRVRNDTGVVVGRNGVLGLSGPVISPVDSEDGFLREVAFAGVTPADPAHRGKFCVLLEPAPVGRVVRAWVAGVCPVLVDVTDADHDYASIIAGDRVKLRSGYDGGAQILWKEDDDPYSGYTTGVQWALVRIGAPRATAAWFKTTATITAASGSSPWTPHSGTADRVRWNGSSWDTIESGVTIWNGTEKGVTTTGSYVFCVIGDDRRWWVTVPDKCGHLT